MRHVLSGLVALGLTLNLMGQAKADYTFATLNVPGSTLPVPLGSTTPARLSGITRMLAALSTASCSMWMAPIPRSIRQDRP